MKEDIDGFDEKTTAFLSAFRRACIELAEELKKVMENLKKDLENENKNPKK